MHQWATWQAPHDSVELLLQHYAEGRVPFAISTGSRFGQCCTWRLRQIVNRIEMYPEPWNLQNDDGMTPRDLALGDESVSEPVIDLFGEHGRFGQIDRDVSRALNLQNDYGMTP